MRHFSSQDKKERKQIAGFVTDYENISVMTVRGAGHMAPGDKPLEALEMFKRFLNGEAY